MVASIRGDPSSWNAYNLILEQLARGMGTSNSSFDIHIKSARHGDFMCNDVNDIAGGVKGIMGKLMYCIGLFSNDDVRKTIQQLVVLFCEGILVNKDSSKFAEHLDELKQKGEVLTAQIDKTFPDRKGKLPRFLM